MIKILKTIGIVLLSIVGLFVLLFIVGYIVDFFSSFPLNTMAKKARVDITSYRMDIKENAWDDYLQAMEKVTSLKFDYEADRYLRGEKNLSSSYPEEIKNYPDIYPFIVQGNQKSACQPPFNYEDGWNMKLPDYLALQKIAKIIAIRAMRALNQNETEKSVNYTTQGLILCDNIIKRGPVPINYMVGVVIYGILRQPLKFGLENNKYNADQLRRLRVALSHSEDSLPLLTWALKCGSDIMKINRYNFTSFGVRLSCWRYFFSPKLALLKGLNIVENSIESISQHEKASTEISNNKNTRGYFYITDSIPEKSLAKNPILKYDDASYGSLLKRKIELVAKLRSLNLAAEIMEKELKVGVLPITTEGLDGKNVLNPLTGKEWNYFYGGDSAVISIPPPDSRDLNRILRLVLKKAGSK